MINTNWILFCRILQLEIRKLKDMMKTNKELVVCLPAQQIQPPPDSQALSLFSECEESPALVSAKAAVSTREWLFIAIYSRLQRGETLMEIDWHHIVRSHKIIAIACLLCAWYFTDKLTYLISFTFSSQVNLSIWHYFYFKDKETLKIRILLRSHSQVHLRARNHISWHHLFRSLVLNWGNFCAPPRPRPQETLSNIQRHSLVFLMGWRVAMASSGQRPRMLLNILQ